MLIEEITNIKQRKAVETHSLDLSKFENKVELSKHLLDISKKKYYDKNKERFKEYYKDNAETIKAKNKERRLKKKESQNIPN
jgi:hypothetical protein